MRKKNHKNTQKKIKSRTFILGNFPRGGGLHKGSLSSKENANFSQENFLKIYQALNSNHSLVGGKIDNFLTRFQNIEKYCEM